VNVVAQTWQLDSSVDQRALLRNVSWRQYELFLEARGESDSPRLTYLGGRLELMTPSIEHEMRGRMIGRLLSEWAIETDTALTACGSWTLKKQHSERGLEPDESFFLGSRRKKRPDLAIEVVWTHGGIDKLEVYAGLGVPEVWQWRKSGLEVFVLRDGSYELRKRSALLRDLDLELLMRHLDADNQHQALLGYRKALRKRKS
jgi:Uma2 family endonuclease